MAQMEDKEIIDWILECRDEADAAKVDRLSRNKNNFDMYHLRHDFSHKEAGQSQEILSKQAMAVEQTKAFFQQSLADFGEWWSAESCYPDAEVAMKVKPHEITKLSDYMLGRANYYSHVGNEVGEALLASLAIAKVSGRLISKPKFVARKKGRGAGLKRWVEKTDDKTWELKLDIVRADNYYPDPSGSGLYEIEDSFPDLHAVKKMAEADEDFDSALTKNLKGGAPDQSEDEFNKARETGQSTPADANRKRVKLTEYWGDILNKDGEVVYENVQAIVANDKIQHIEIRNK